VMMVGYCQNWDNGELDITNCGVRWCDWRAIEWLCCQDSWGEFDEVLLL